MYSMARTATVRPKMYFVVEKNNIIMLYFVLNTLPKTSFTSLVTVIGIWGYTPVWITGVLFYVLHCECFCECGQIGLHGELEMELAYRTSPFHNVPRYLLKIIP